VSTTTEHTDAEKQALESLRKGRDLLVEQLGRVIVGQHETVEKLLVALFCQGHCLMIGVPGLAKTLMVKTLADILELEFSRIQFTPDLMPSDIIGTDILQEDATTGTREFKFIHGPIFGNMILADEINRTPPKTQAALLEAMQEHRVTAGGETRVLEEPFFVIATQNPIEQEGTYPLPEAQLDRFMFNIQVGYPTTDEEVEIVLRTTSGALPELDRVLTAQQVVDVQNIVRRVPVSEEVVRYAVEFVAATRPDHPQAPDVVKRYVRWGAGPRASQYLILGGKARSLLRGEYCVDYSDVRAIAHEVLAHRIVTNFQAEADGVRQHDLVTKLLEAVPPPR